MENSVKFAKMVQNNVVRQAGRADKGVHQAGFLVLRETSMPSVLIELGFISTPEEERQLNDKSVQEKIARAMFEAFKSYYKGGTTAAAPATTPVSTPVETPAPAPVASTLAPAPTSSPTTGTTYRVQIFASSSKLKAKDSRFKGLTNADYYQENGLYKYTVGNCATLEEAKKLRREIADKFPEAFVVTFNNGKKQ